MAENTGLAIKTDGIKEGGVFLVNLKCITNEGVGVSRQEFLPIGVDLSGMRKIFLAHRHGDHFGFTRRLKEVSNCIGYIDEDDLKNAKNVYLDFNGNMKHSKMLLKRLGMLDKKIEKKSIILFMNSVYMLKTLKDAMLWWRVRNIGFIKIG